MADLTGNPDVGEARSVYVETYGCQMNVSDSELITGVFAARGYVERARLPTRPT